MPIATVSSKYQITLPAEIARGAGIKPGSKLVVEFINGRIVMLPQPENWTTYFVGSLKGVYGATKEEADQYLAGERASWERQEWYERFEDLQVKNEAVKAVVAALLQEPDFSATPNRLADITGLKDWGKVSDALVQLTEHGWVREVPLEEGDDRQINVKYRLVRDLAHIAVRT
jgi:antitoxin ChpS